MSLEASMGEEGRQKRLVREEGWSWAWWCTPVVPVTWEAEGGGSQVQSQPLQLSEIPYLGMWLRVQSSAKNKNKKQQQQKNLSGMALGTE